MPAWRLKKGEGATLEPKIIRGLLYFNWQKLLGQYLSIFVSILIRFYFEWKSQDFDIRYETLNEV